MISICITQVALNLGVIVLRQAQDKLSSVAIPSSRSLEIAALPLVARNDSVKRATN